MKTNKVIAIATLATVLVGGYMIYKTKFWVKKPTLSESIDFIIASKKASNREVLQGFDSGYVISWATAIKNNKATFKFNGKKYNVEGGKLAK